MNYLLGGRLKCIYCGSAIVPRYAPWDSRHYYYYVCAGSTNKHHYNYCKSYSVRIEILDELVWKWVIDHLTDPELIIAGLRYHREKIEEINKATYEKISEIEKKIEDLKGRMSHLIDLYANQAITRDMIDQKVEEISTTISNLVLEKEDLQRSLCSSKDVEDIIQSLVNFLDGISDLSNMDLSDKIEILDMIQLRGKLGCSQSKKWNLQVTSLLGNASFSSEDTCK